MNIDFCPKKVAIYYWTACRNVTSNTQVFAEENDTKLRHKYEIKIQKNIHVR